MKTETTETTETNSKIIITEKTRNTIVGIGIGIGIVAAILVPVPNPGAFIMMGFAITALGTFLMTEVK